MKLKSSTKFSLITIVLLLVVVLGLMLTNKKEVKAVKKSTNICDLASFYKGDKFGTISYCLNDKAEISINNEEEVDINVDNIKDFYYFYNVINDTSYFYLINGDGDIFESDSNKLIEKDFKFKKMDVKNAVKLKTLTDNSTKKFSIYAIDENNDLFLLRTLY